MPAACRRQDPSTSCRSDNSGHICFLEAHIWNGLSIEWKPKFERETGTWELPWYPAGEPDE